jgi:hypothetical protein
MKKTFIIFVTLFTILTFPKCYALSLKGSYSATNMAKYYPQTTNYNYRKPNKTYIYSSQQAKYYGYSIPQTTSNPYYNPYTKQ